MRRADGWADGRATAYVVARRLACLSQLRLEGGRLGPPVMASQRHRSTTRSQRSGCEPTRAPLLQRDQADAEGPCRPLRLPVRVGRSAGCLRRRPLIALVSESAGIRSAYVQGCPAGTAGFDSLLRQYGALVDHLPVVPVIDSTTSARPSRHPGRPRSKGLHHARHCPFGANPRATSCTPPTAAGRAAALRTLRPEGSSSAERRTECTRQEVVPRSRRQPWCEHWCAAGDLVLDALRMLVVFARVGPGPLFESLVISRWYPDFSPSEPRHDTHHAAA